MKNYLYKVERYNNTAFRVIRFNNQRSSSTSSSDFEFDEHSQEEISLSRTKRNVRRICLSNDFEYFATWTIDSKLCDRYSLTDCVEKMKKLLKAFQRKYKDFKYIYVIEKHIDGAFHFHGLIKGVPIEVFEQFKIGDKMSYKIAGKVFKGCKIYHIPFFDNKLGYNTFTKIQFYNKCCNYILKYISKDNIQTTEGQRYFCSRGLSKGESYEVKYIPYELFDSQNSYSLDDLIIVRDLYLDELKRDDLFSFGNLEDKKSIDFVIEGIKSCIIPKRF